MVTLAEPGDAVLKLIPAPPEAIGEESLLIAAVRLMAVPPVAGVRPPALSAGHLSNDYPVASCFCCSELLVEGNVN
jgi:hypothetical protein